MDGFIAAVVVAVRIDLNHQRKPFYSFLWGEVCAQAIHCDENLCGREIIFLNVVQTTIKFLETQDNKGEIKADTPAQKKKIQLRSTLGISHSFSPLLS